MKEFDQTQAGVHVSNEGELKEYLMKAYREYKELSVICTELKWMS